MGNSTGAAGKKQGASDVVGVSGSVSPAGSTTALLRLALTALRERKLGTALIDLGSTPLAWCDGRDPDGYDEETVRAIETVSRAGGCVIATPVYRGSLSGRLKNFIDLLPISALAGKPVWLLASGGSMQHHLAIDYALRPVVSQFGALLSPAGTYASPDDFEEGKPRRELLERIDQAADAFCALVHLRSHVPTDAQER